MWPARRPHWHIPGRLRGTDEPRRGAPIFSPGIVFFVCNCRVLPVTNACPGKRPLKRRWVLFFGSLRPISSLITFPSRCYEWLISVDVFQRDKSLERWVRRHVALGNPATYGMLSETCQFIHNCFTLRRSGGDCCRVWWKNEFESLVVQTTSVEGSSLVVLADVSWWRFWNILVHEAAESSNKQGWRFVPNIESVLTILGSNYRLACATRARNNAPGLQ